MAATNHYYGWVEVNKSFYTTFNGRRFYCNVPELYLGSQQAKMRVKYRDGDEEYYSLKSSDGVLFSGTMGTDDDNRVDFELWKHDRIIVLAGNWKCGGRQGEWYIEGTSKNQ
ncbi:MAG: hypothetical protein GX267_05175 [Fibrobacter sp.]|jgi:hypothetical protein|nr:hypothetical protein [Fibrobacter sp.]